MQSHMVLPYDQQVCRRYSFILTELDYGWQNSLSSGLGMRGIHIWWTRWPPRILNVFGPGAFIYRLLLLGHHEGETSGISDTLSTRFRKGVGVFLMTLKTQKYCRSSFATVPVAIPLTPLDPHAFCRRRLQLQPVCNTFNFTWKTRLNHG